MFAMPTEALKSCPEKHRLWKEPGKICSNINAVDLLLDIGNGAARQQKCFAEIFLYNNPKWHAVDGYQRNRAAGIRRVYEARVSVIAGATE